MRTRLHATLSCQKDNFGQLRNPHCVRAFGRMQRRCLRRFESNQFSSGLTLRIVSGMYSAATAIVATTTATTMATSGNQHLCQTSCLMHVAPKTPALTDRERHALVVDSRGAGQKHDRTCVYACVYVGHRTGCTFCSVSPPHQKSLAVSIAQIRRINRHSVRKLHPIWYARLDAVACMKPPRHVRLCRSKRHAGFPQ